jgi:hypothetical protein
MWVPAMTPLRINDFALSGVAATILCAMASSERKRGGLMFSDRIKWGPKAPKNSVFSIPWISEWHFFEDETLIFWEPGRWTFQPVESIFQRKPTPKKSLKSCQGTTCCLDHCTLPCPESTPLSHHMYCYVDTDLQDYAWAPKMHEKTPTFKCLIWLMLGNPTKSLIFRLWMTLWITNLSIASFRVWIFIPKSFLRNSFLFLRPWSHTLPWVGGGKR